MAIITDEIRRLIEEETERWRIIAEGHKQACIKCADDVHDKNVEIERLRKENDYLRKELDEISKI